MPKHQSHLLPECLECWLLIDIFTSPHFGGPSGEKANSKNVSNRGDDPYISVEVQVSRGEGERWACPEEWVFTFGFVIPGSTNSWQSVVLSAKDEREHVISASRDMKGVQFVIETNFYDDKKFICKKSVRVCYV